MVRVIHEFGGAAVALTVFVVQIGLNALWSYLFFGLHRPDVAFYAIIALWVEIVAVAALFWRVDHVAGGPMVPYLVRAGFASYLNFVGGG
jgi:tryptophan-rich sensory protein